MWHAVSPRCSIGSLYRPVCPLYRRLSSTGVSVVQRRLSGLELLRNIGECGK